MKSAHLVLLSTVLVSIPLLAQTNRAPLPDQANGAPIATFAKPVQYNSGAGWHQEVRAVVADVNGDRKPDLLVADKCTDEPDDWDCNGLIAVLLGNGDGTFQAAVTYDSGGWLADSVTVADVNGDGIPDLVVANECNPAPSHCYNGKMGLLGVLLGNGDGTFQAAVTYDSGGYQAASVAVADVNGDGIPDLVVANQCASFVNVHDICSGGGTVGVLLGNGDGTFQGAVTYGSGGYLADSIAVADVNGDGKPDLLVANPCASFVDGSCSGSGTVSVLLGKGNGTFQAAVSYGSGGYGSGGHLSDSVAVADVNGDGKPDLLLANPCAGYVDGACSGSGTVGVLLGNGDGTFQAAVSYGSGGYLADSLAVADVNGDGIPDLLVANQCTATVCNGLVGVLLGNGNGTFQAAETLKVKARAYSVAVADVNGDGKPDLLVGNMSDHGAVAVFINTTR